MVRILMAEDDAASREVLELNLEAWNYVIPLFAKMGPRPGPRCRNRMHRDWSY